MTGFSSRQWVNKPVTPEDPKTVKKRAVTARWKRENPEKYREYMREYMREYRAGKRRRD